MRATSFEAHGRAVGVGAQHDAAELLDAGELAVDHHGGAMPWPVDVGQAADGAGRDLRVLGPDRRAHVGGAQVVASSRAGRSRSAWRARCRTAAPGRRRQALQLGHHVARGVVAQRDRVPRRIVGRQDREQQEVAERDLSTRTPAASPPPAAKARVARDRRFCTSTCARSGWCRAEAQRDVARSRRPGHRLHVDQAGRAVHLCSITASTLSSSVGPRRPDRRRRRRWMAAPPADIARSAAA